MIDFDKRWYPWLYLLQALVWRIGILGFLQIVGAFLTAVFVCPIASVGVLIGKFHYCVSFFYNTE